MKLYYALIILTIIAFCITALLLFGIWGVLIIGIGAAQLKS